MLPVMWPNTHSLCETTLLQLPSPLEKFVAQSYPSPWVDFKFSLQKQPVTSRCHLKDPNKKGLTTVVDDERTPGVALTGVLDNTFPL